MKSVYFKKISIIARTVKVGLAMVIPILFIGSITVMLNGFPIIEYQEFLDTYMGGAIRSIIQTIQYSTVGILAIYITIAVSLSYMNQTKNDRGLVLRFGGILSCVNAFFILVGFFAGEPDFSLLSGQGVFSALLAGIIGSVLFSRFEKIFVKRKMVFVDGADSEFNATLQVILPFLAVTVCFAAANYLITVCFDVQSVQHLFMKAMEAVFDKMQRSYSSGLLFTTLISTMWWFGIHGNNVLNQVAEDMFTAIIPGETVSKSFIDTFVNMGGTGCTIGLLIALIIFGKRRSTKRLSGMALLPGIFNIGELLVFGFPVIYNPLMVIPFITAPMICFSNAFLLTQVGFLPQVTNEVVWTTPALMSGYLATGSVRGIIVQIMNIMISTACYAPFVIRYEKKSLHTFSGEFDKLVDIIKKSEGSKEDTVLIDREGNVGRLAKLLAIDLESSISASSRKAKRDNVESPVYVEYKKKFDDTGQCIYAKARLRWKHKMYGYIYPPLAIRIAKESGDLFRLETYIMERAVCDSCDLRKDHGDKFVMKINVTLSTMCDKRFVPFLKEVADRYRLKTGNICLVITEDNNNDVEGDTTELKNIIRSLGYVLMYEDSEG